ncbi:unnamed protein product [Mycena citricolor]|uniref:RRM domain-containing protein n=1 Tax=Mycena citricolor TaxID=2018698 RepID=A0AAD2HAJ2_9AGAR|nr:unnamed protein product [Mycena citricolor]CAK5271352.1 unnamed protein product [Mycena citricolor]
MFAGLIRRQALLTTLRPSRGSFFSTTARILADDKRLLIRLKKVGPNFPKEELQAAFDAYGPNTLDLLPARKTPPPFAFVSFEKSADAASAAASASLKEKFAVEYSRDIVPRAKKA